MKKLTWIMALLITMALVVTGCPGGGDPDDKEEGDQSAKNWYLATDDDGAKAPNNQLTLQAQQEDHYIRIFFDASGKDFDKIKIDFTLNPGANVSWQSVWTGEGENKTTWGQGGNDYIDFLESGPIEVDPATMFTSKWSGPATDLIKEDINFICIRVSVPDDPSVFTLTGVTFTGAKSGGGEEEVTSNWYLSETENGTAANGNSKTGSGTGENAWYVYIYFDPVPEGIATINIDFSTTGNITLIKQCVYDDTGTWGWGWGDVSPGSFALSGASSWGASGTALDLTTLKGICIKIEGDGTFTLTNVTITKSTD